MPPTPSPARGDIWIADLDPVVGHEQGRVRPVVIVSIDDINSGHTEIVVAVPLTTKNKGVPLHVPIDPHGTGLIKLSFARCEDIRSLSTQRLRNRVGKVADETLAEVEDRLRILLDL